MSEEKSAAFLESWKAMSMAAAQANQRIAMSFVRSMWMLPAARPAPSAIVNQWQSATLGVLGKGMAPVRRRAVANAKRLSRTKLTTL